MLASTSKLNGCYLFSFLVSFLAGKGKKTAWEIWKLYPDLTPILGNLTSPLPVLNNISMATIERFVILLYDKISVHTEVRFRDEYIIILYTAVNA